MEVHNRNQSMDAEHFLMTTKLLIAKPAVEEIKNHLLERCLSLKQRGIIPSMSVVLIGNSPASLSYIKNKRKMCEEVGARFQLHQLGEDVTAPEFLKLISQLNDDERIHGIIIQLPVSDHLKNLNLPNLVKPSKDIDGFHGENNQKLYAGSTNLQQLMPCTPKGIIQLLQHYDFNLQGKHAVVVGRSLIVGKPLSLLLSNFGATVTLAHSQTKDLKSLTRSADLVVAAIGKANFFNFTFFDPGRRTVVIDVGMNSLNGKLTGDVEILSVTNVVSAISPVPGGVGPMTVVSLIENLIIAAETIRHSY